MRHIIGAVVLVVAWGSLSQARAQTHKPKLAVMPLAANRVSPDTAKILDELLINQVDSLGKYQVIGASDINAMLGLEKMKEALGCDAIACAAEIGGALGVDRLLAGSVSSLGGVLLVSLKLVNIQAQSVEGRSQIKADDDEKLYMGAVEQAVVELFQAAAPKNATGYGSDSDHSSGGSSRYSPGSETEPVNASESVATNEHLKESRAL